MLPFGKWINHKSLTRPERRRSVGTASTTTHSASIANPKNSKTNASNMEVPPTKPLDLSGTH